MDTTDRTHRLALPYLANDQAQKHVTVNEGLRALDALVQPSVLSAGRDAQPEGAAPGDAYLMTAARTGAAWAGYAEHELAAFQDGAWARFAPSVGMTVWVADEGRHRVWNGTAWAATASGDGGGGAPAAPQTRADLFGVNADASGTNRLAVKSDAVLHSHDDASGQGSGDARHVINKAGEARTASLVFQSGYAGRAEMGLAGSDDFSFKVSADGAVFNEAIVIDRATGAVSFPNTPETGGGGGAAPAGPKVAQVLATDTTTNINTTERMSVPITGEVMGPFDADAFEIDGRGIKVLRAGRVLASATMMNFKPAPQRASQRISFAVNGTDLEGSADSSYMRMASGHEGASSSITRWIEVEAGDTIYLRSIAESATGTATMRPRCSFMNLTLF